MQGITIMKWGNWVPLIKVLKFRITQKLVDGKLDETEMTQVITGFIGDMEDIPSWLDVSMEQLEKFCGMVYAALGIDWDIPLDADQVETVANIIILALKYWK